MRLTYLKKIYTSPWRLTRKSWKKFKIILKQKLGWLGIPVIIPYRGYASRKMFYLRGMVTEDKGIKKPEKRHSTWQNILAMLKRYSSDEIPDVYVEVEVEGKKIEAVTDEDGYFSIKDHEFKAPEKSDKGWIKYQTRSEIKTNGESHTASSEGEILIPDANDRVGLISDIDDTILVSHSNTTFQKLRLMLFRNAHTRKPFPGATAFYTAIHKGFTGNEFNPVFYVSSSEWNLYDLLDDFTAHNEFPKGVFLLRDLKANVLKFWKSGKGDHNHKLNKIRGILDQFDHIPFVLIGDNGQRDPEIYTRITREYPGRIKVIYIRHISNKKSKRIEHLVADVKKHGTDMLLVKDTFEAARDAIKRKLIPEDAIKDISIDRKKDETASKITGIREEDSKSTLLK